MESTHSVRRYAPIAVATILVVTAILFMTTMSPKNMHDHGAIDVRHVPATILSSEKYLWAEIIEQITQAPDRTIPSVLQSVEAKDPALLICPVEKTRLTVNPDMDLWKSMAKPDAVAIVSTVQVADSEQPYYQAIRFDGSGIKIAQLPEWAKTNQ